MVPENKRAFHLFPFQVTHTAAAKELTWPLPIGALEDAYGEEVQLFIHCHLRGYDKEGEGKQLHADFYDQYGAPVKKQESWLEGKEYITINKCSVLFSSPPPENIYIYVLRIFCAQKVFQLLPVRHFPEIFGAQFLTRFNLPHAIFPTFPALPPLKNEVWLGNKREIKP